MKHARRSYLAAFFLLLITSLALADAKIYQQQIAIPTYGVEAPDPNPRFYSGRVYQGAQGRIYPYPISDVLTNEKADKTYSAVYLENDYIKICVLPEIGGRIFEAVDKTNGYNFFYKQSIVKPSLIGMLGAWISGGVEWNFPHHHRANTFMPMDYELAQNPDGSATLWLTEIEQRHRMKMLIGLTITPNSSVLQAELKFINRTSFVHSFLYFANPAVHVDSTYQVIFPPEVEYVTQHAKREFAQWPVANARYGGYDYKNVDISWWKNLPDPVSFFAWDHTSNYFAGYDHGKKAGVAYVADVNLAPGKKFFTFGCGDEGKMWDKMLTDTDGPYLELMAGAYSDNQPDYSWIQPYETKVIKQFWFPIRDLGGMSFANLHGALNLAVTNNTANLSVLTTAKQPGAKISLISGNKFLLDKKFDLAPNAVFQVAVPLGKNIADSALVVTVLSQDGKELLRYQPVTRAGAPMPKRVQPPTKPEDYKTAEELYLAGLRLDEFHNPQIDPYPYYAQALKLDSNDVRVNTQLGILYSKRAMWPEAAKHLQRAVDRLTYNYTRPKDGEPHYYLGLALRALGKTDAAYKVFYRAAWNFAWRAAAFYQLAELDCLNGEYDKALDHVNEALVVNGQNVKALNLKTAILRHLNRLAEAAQINALVAAIDPIDYWAKNETGEIQQTNGDTAAAQQAQAELSQRMRDNPQLYLELATDYGNAGFYADAIAVLHRPQVAYPLLSYYIAYYSHFLGDEAMAAYFLVQGSTQPPDYCFPFRLEDAPVLNFAIEQQPQDARAFYYLGNLLFDWQPEKAVQLWQKAADLDLEFAQAHRNLGFGYSQVKNDLPRAIAHYREAIKFNKTDARLFYELDVLAEMVNMETAARLDLLKKNKKVIVKRDDALARLTELQVLAGDYDDAIETLTTHHFNVWEGGGDIHNVFVEAHLLRGLAYLNDSKAAKALADFQTATEYPDNLEVGRPIYDQNACRALYLLGLAYAQHGEPDKAREAFTAATKMDVNENLLYYKGAAFLQLENKTEADAIFDRLIKSGQERLASTGEIDFFAKFGERGAHNTRMARAHYLIGLGYYGKGELDQAAAEMAQAQQLNVNDVWVNYYAALLQADKK